jgi:nicotinamide riboside kinase
MRRKMRADADEARHPERAAERIRYRAAAEQALAEMHKRFPVLTSDNFEEANRFREARTQELIRAK